MQGKVIAVSISEKKGTIKNVCENGVEVDLMGIVGDAHAGDWHRQVSLLDQTSVQKMRDRGPKALCRVFLLKILPLRGWTFTVCRLERNFKSTTLF